MRLLPPPGAARAVQVTALPRKREAGRWAPGFPGPLPAPSAVRAGPRARDAPPRGTVRTGGSPCKGKGKHPLPGSGDTDWSPRWWTKTRYASALQGAWLTPPRVRTLGTHGAKSYISPLLCYVASGVRKEVVKMETFLRISEHKFSRISEPFPQHTAPSVSLSFHSSPRVVSPSPYLCIC